MTDCKHGVPSHACDDCQQEYIDRLKARLERAEKALQEIASAKGHSAKDADIARECLKEIEK